MSDPIQTRYFDFADRERFEWTVAGPGFADTEDDLLAPLLPLIEPPLLEIGCGEGNNLYRLRGAGYCVGTDLFTPKVAFARRAVAEVDFAAADAAALPFGGAAFQTVFIRDLLHHAPEPPRVLAEAMRVLRPGGRFLLIEPNGRNPLVNLQSRLIAAEREARTFNPTHVAALLRDLPLTEVAISTAHPLPLRRLIFHYKLGMPSLGQRPSVRRSLAAVERAMTKIIPPSRWEHVVATARRNPTGPLPSTAR